MIVCVGCSWTRDWPKFLPNSMDVVHRYYDGKGLGFIREKLRSDLKEESNRADRIVIQLPTPLRSIDLDGSPRTMTFLKFVERVWKGKHGERRDRLMKSYQGEIEKLASDFPGRVVFLVFNTGGYPFRCPYDFGEKSQPDMMQFLGEKQLPHVLVDFEGVPGVCVQETEIDDGSGPKERVNVVQPAGPVRIVNPHPNEIACRRAAREVQKLLELRISRMNPA